MNLPVPEQWAGDNPFFLLVVRRDQMMLIDLDERGWMETYKDIFSRTDEATWHLVEKLGQGIAFSLIVRVGEKPYYLARHFERATVEEGQVQAHVSAYGIGKRRAKSRQVDSLWIFTDGQICTGDDVNIFGQAKLAAM